jgi:DNA-directed RNA polymerase specialized sigma24 family protein
MTAVHNQVQNEGFDAFYRRDYGAVLALAYALSGSGKGASRLAEGALRAVKRLPAGRGEAVRRLIVKRALSGWRRKLAELPGRGRRLAPQLNPDDEEFWGLVRILPALQAEAVALFYLEGLTPEQVAVVLGLDPDDGKRTLVRGRKALVSGLGVPGSLVTVNLEARAAQAVAGVRAAVTQALTPGSRNSAAAGGRPWRRAAFSWSAVLGATAAIVWLMNPVADGQQPYAGHPTTTSGAAVSIPPPTVEESTTTEAPPTTGPPVTAGNPTTGVWLSITWPGDGAAVAQHVVTFQGRTTPGARIFSGNQEAQVSGNGNWTLTLNLVDGPNRVTFRARGAGGARATAALTVTVVPPSTTTSQVTTTTIQATTTSQGTTTTGTTLPGSTTSTSAASTTTTTDTTAPPTTTTDTTTDTTTTTDP